MERTRRDFAFLLLTLAATALGGVGVYGYGAALVNTVSARAWRPTPCTIVSAKSEGYGNRSDLVVVFEYRVAGVTYRCDRYTFGPARVRPTSALLVSVRPGTEATCYVDPSNPARAVLDRGPKPALLFGLIPLVIFILFGLAGLGGLIETITAARRWWVGGGPEVKPQSPPHLHQSDAAPKPSAAR